MPSIKSPFTVVLLLVTFSLLSMVRWAAEVKGFNLPLPELLSKEQKLTASDGALLDDFGHSVAFSGSTVVVGAWHDDIGGNLDQGSIYVFNRQGGEWVETQKPTASDGAAGDNFGHAIAVSGSTIVVGAYHDDVGGNLDQGSVYVFTRQGANWVETQKLTASDGAADLAFGWSVSFSGSTIVVGAIGDNVFRGAVYVFNRQGGSWVEEQKLTASDGAPNADFGHSVVVSGSTIVVGAIGDNGAEGSAYVFNRQGGSWAEEQKLTASDGEPVEFFGRAVAISGSTIVISAPNDNVFQGAAYVFERQGRSWVEEQKLTASDGTRGEEFGWSLAISGATIVVGIPSKTIGGNDVQGAAYVFNRQGGSWFEGQKLIASDGGFADSFGFSVAISGSTVVVGAPNGGDINQGAAYVFEP